MQTVWQRESILTTNMSSVLPQVTPVEDGCIFSYVIQLDMKGYVPLFFSNLIQTQHPLIISMLRRYLEGGHSPEH